ncbi:signal recognition particle 19 kDa protein-like [Salvia splendens]|uniref:signal recognition particle 19 kDa protein-like n=1 Tax=Salvia splendens TaxID=180675 RepID=UPI001C27E04C|nr:signal recognition particle 19 kDa protein-like [Salvia splendens]
MHFILHQRGILYLATAVDQFGLSSIQNCKGYIELIYFHLFYGNIMDVDLSNIKKWVIVYPIYINSKKTLAEGRRINASKACENPTCTEVYDCCAHLKIPRVIEAYPRDFMQRGRVRVMLKKEDGSFYNPAISSRKQLMLHVAELVRQHPGRTKKQEPATSAAAGSKYGKGGKKKR